MTTLRCRVVQSTCSLMSNAYRTPLLDPFRNAIRILVPSGPSGIFSLRDHRSSLKAIYRAGQYKSELRHALKSNDLKQVVPCVQNVMDFIGVTNPHIIGKGVWFKFWSGRLQRHMKEWIRTECVTSPLLRDALPMASPFSSPLEVSSLRNPAISTKQLEDSVAAFRRVIGTVFFKFPKIYFHPKDVKGLAFQKRRLESHSPFTWGQYEIRCDGNGREFTAFIENRATRSKILNEYYKVFDESDEFHSAILDVLRARKAFSQQLGFKSWTDMQARINGLANEGSGLALVDQMYKQGQPQIKSVLARMRRIPLDIDKRIPPGSPAWTTVDEAFLLNAIRPSVRDLKNENMFEFSRIIAKIVEKIGQLFSITIEPVSHSLWSHGWHPDVQVFRVQSADNEEEIGYIYLDLFRRMSSLAGAGPHCSALSPSTKHVRIYMGLQPPYRSDITFRKERFLTYEEITAIMHEFGHAVHVLLRPEGSPIAQLPLDMRETVSIATELYSLTDDCVDWLTDGKVSAKERSAIRRDEWFYVDILRNVAVSEHIHSSRFHPDIETPGGLRNVVREIYGKYSPIPLGDFVNPLGGELSNYLIDGESRVGYIQSYMRASSLLMDVERGKLSVPDMLRKLTCDFIQREFDPFVSGALESIAHTATDMKHPLPPIANHPQEVSTALFKNSYTSAPWDICAMHRSAGK